MNMREPVDYLQEREAPAADLWVDVLFENVPEHWTEHKHRLLQEDSLEELWRDLMGLPDIPHQYPSTVTEDNIDIARRYLGRYRFPGGLSRKASPASSLLIPKRNGEESSAKVDEVDDLMWEDFMGFTPKPGPGL